MEGGGRRKEGIWGLGGGGEEERIDGKKKRKSSDLDLNLEFPT